MFWGRETVLHGWETLARGIAGASTCDTRGIDVLDENRRVGSIACE